MSTEPPIDNDAPEKTAELDSRRIATRSGRTDLRRLYRLSSKELLEILRDRRTIITLVLMPLLVYPLLGMIVQKFMINSIASGVGTVEYVIAVEGEQRREDFAKLIARSERALAQRNESPSSENKSPDEPKEPSGSKNDQAQKTDKADGKIDPALVQDLLTGGNKPPTIKYLDSESIGISLEELVESGAADLGVRWKQIDDIKNRKGDTVLKVKNLEFVKRNGSSQSEFLSTYITKRIEIWNFDWVRRMLRRQVQIHPPYKYNTIEVEPPPKTSADLLAFVPLMLVLMTMTGAVYPAIDLTAGERERGTMEILMAAPVSRMSLLFGKFVAVLTVAMLTAIINMFSMLVSVYTLGLDSIIFGDQGISFSIFLTIFVMLLVFAGFFSAVLLGLTSFARSFKEAQAYLIPIMLMAFAPGILSLMPGVKMSVPMALAPLLNIVLLGRDVISGQFDLAYIAITLISTILYGFLALGMAARVFGTDSVLFGGSSTWSDFFRRSSQKQMVPSMPTALLFLSVLFPSFVIAAGLSSRIDASFTTRLIINAVITIGLFVGLPLIFSKTFHLKSKTSFLLYRPRKLALLSSILLGISVWTLAFEIEVLSLSGNRLDRLKEIFESMKYELQEIPLFWKLMCLAVVPAVCEEFTFRGFLFSAFRKHCRPIETIIGTAVLFGLFHVFVRDALMFERMIPSTLLGILLGFVCYRTGSVIPGMLFHSIHNGLLITLSHYEQQLTDWGIGITDQQHLPLQFILVAAIPISVGLGLLALRTVKSKSLLRSLKSDTTKNIPTPVTAVSDATQHTSP